MGVTVVCEANKGVNIYEASCDAVDVAKILRLDVELMFNGVRLAVDWINDTGHTVMARYREHVQESSADEGQS